VANRRADRGKARGHDLSRAAEIDGCEAVENQCLFGTRISTRVPRPGPEATFMLPPAASMRTRCEANPTCPSASRDCSAEGAAPRAEPNRWQATLGDAAVDGWRRDAQEARGLLDGQEGDVGRAPRRRHAEIPHVYSSHQRSPRLSASRRNAAEASARRATDRRLSARSRALPRNSSRPRRNGWVVAVMLPTIPGEKEMWASGSRVTGSWCVQILTSLGAPPTAPRPSRDE